MIWNFVASIEYSFQSAILVLIITRINGLYDAGIFTFAYTITQMMTTIGNYGMRGFQVSDSQKEYSFHEYFSSRILTTFIMLALCVGFTGVYGWNEDKGKLIFILGLYRVIEVFEDVIHGEMQRVKRLDVGAKIEAVRIFAVTIIFIIACVFLHNVVIASIIMTVCSFCIVLVMNALAVRIFINISFKIEIFKLQKLLLACMPICASDFLYNNLVNAPKYAIERNLSEESQAIFSILFMPVFTINMLSSFIYKPLMADMGIYWNGRDTQRFWQIIFKQLIIIIALTLLIVIGGVTVGLDFLGYIYDVAIREYKGLFALLLVFGGVAALDSFLVITLTVIRKQYWAIVAYVIAILCVWVGIDRAVCIFGLWGAGILYGASVGVVMLVLLPVVFVVLYKSINIRANNEFK